MEISKLNLARASTAADEEDDFYEHIEAPKFVDLTAPDTARPTDDASWFCLRIGCDQSHEQVDAEALHRSFTLRVMAARSPNVWLHKAVRSRNQSLMPRCPLSAPAKPPRARMTRLSTAADKAAKPKLKCHRISSLRASPRKPNARIEVSSARKKALTTPRSKSARPAQEPFLSAKHQREPVVAATRNAAVAKALFMNTPKKEAIQTPLKSGAPVSEVCAKMRKLNLAGREVPSRYLCQLPNRKAAKIGEESAAKSVKRGQASAMASAKKRVLGRSVNCLNVKIDDGNRNGCHNVAADENSCTGTASSNDVEHDQLEESRTEVEASQPDSSDDNKENLSYEARPMEESSNGAHFESQSSQSENNENVPQKVAKMQNKVNAEQGGKVRKTTNPKPFRLRTDERRILKEANPERNRMFITKDSVVVPRNGDGETMEMDKYPDGNGSDKPIYGNKQKKQRTQIQLGEAKLARNNIRCNNLVNTKGKFGDKAQRVPRVTPSSRTNKAESSMFPPHIRKEKKSPVKTSRLQAAAA